MNEGPTLFEGHRRRLISHTLAEVDWGEVTVFIHSSVYLPTLERQDYRAVALVSWNDDSWHLEASKIAGGRGWSHTRVGTPPEALKACSSASLIDWNVYKASTDALSSLVKAAFEDPNSAGAVAANFDPAILWKRQAFSRGSKLFGLVRSSAFAIDRGGSSGLTPMR